MSDPVLANQSRQRNSRYWRHRIRVCLHWCTLPCVALFPIFVLIQLFTAKDSPWEEDHSFVFSTNLSSAEQLHILKRLDYLPKSASIKDLAIFLLQDSPYARVQIIRQTHRQTYLEFIPYDAVLRLDVGKIRLVSAAGQVYGLAQSSDLPLLKDFFSTEKVNSELGVDNRLILSALQQKRLSEVIDLQLNARAYELIFQEYWFVRYRGFYGKLKEGGTEVVLGRSPFDCKLKRLKQLLVRRSGLLAAARIELDYRDKIFVKEQQTKTLSPL